MTDPTTPTDADREAAREWADERQVSADYEAVYALGLAAGRAGLTWTGTPPDRLGLMCLRLIRQLPRDNPVRRDAESLVLELGLCDLDHVLRNDKLETALRGIDDSFRRCPACDGQMHHERLRGWVCGRGCQP